MKTKYERMNKKEKKQCQEKYFKTSKGQEMRKRFSRLNIIGTIGILFSIFLIVSGYIQKEVNWATWTMAIILTIFSLIYIIGAYILKKQCLNNFAIKNMK